jgi:hypothetical protein
MIVVYELYDNGLHAHNPGRSKARGDANSAISPSQRESKGIHVIIPKSAG